MDLTFRVTITLLNINFINDNVSITAILDIPRFLDLRGVKLIKINLLK